MKQLLAFLFITGLLITGCLDRGASDDTGRDRSPGPSRPIETNEPSETRGPAPEAGGSASPGGGEPDAGQEPEAVVEELTVLVDRLRIPWSIQLLDGVFYLTERTGSVVRIENGRLERQRAELAKPLSDAAEAGLLGFVQAPDFAETRMAYAYYTYEDGNRPYNRIVVLRQEGTVWKEEKVLVDRIPSGSVHHGGRLNIGPDGMLYATTGDAADAGIAQDPGSLGGKILRLRPDGSIPEDNPFPGSYVYTYGHRNPQGLAWAPDGTMYASEHGNRANDEINVIEPGQNYGWPVIQGTERRQGYVTPLFTSGSGTTWAPSGMAYANGKLYVAALRGSAVLEFDPASGGHREAITGFGRIRDVLIDGPYLYFITNNTDGRGRPQPDDDKLYRIALSRLEP